MYFKYRVTGLVHGMEVPLRDEFFLERLSLSPVFMQVILIKCSWTHTGRCESRKGAYREEEQVQW